MPRVSEKAALKLKSRLYIYLLFPTIYGGYVYRRRRATRQHCTHQQAIDIEPRGACGERFCRVYTRRIYIYMNLLYIYASRTARAKATHRLYNNTHTQQPASAPFGARLYPLYSCLLAVYMQLAILLAFALACLLLSLMGSANDYWPADLGGTILRVPLLYTILIFPHSTAHRFTAVCVCCMVPVYHMPFMAFVFLFLFLFFYSFFFFVLYSCQLTSSFDDDGKAHIYLRVDSFY